jgi:hypothetical protein
MDKMNEQGESLNKPIKELAKDAWERTKTPEFQESLKASIAEANKGITHAEFVTGMQNKTIGFKCLLGEPCQLIRGTKKTIFNILVLFYMAAPLIIIPLWSYHVGNWWLLVGIVISYAASFSAANGSKIIFLFACFCAGFWILSGFSIYQYITFYFFCALWGYTLFRMAESAQTEYAIQSLIESPELFNEAIAQNKIMIVRRRDDENTRGE